MKVLLFVLILLFAQIGFCQINDSVFIRQIFTEALSDGNSYEDLRSLCKDVGPRLSGSSEAEMAIVWSERKMKSYGFDKVYLQEIKVPHWERGTKESGWIEKKSGELIRVNMLALGGSIGTDNKILKGEIIEFETLDELKKTDAKLVAGKIVFLNQEMDEKMINTFRAYGGCYPIRGDGAVEAAKKGAVGVIIRSLALPIDVHPHTGGLHYENDVIKIPGAAISTYDAELLSQLLSTESAEFLMEMDCRTLEDKVSYNVIAEMTGTESPNEIITFGGHLDSWDTGEGAHDDGAGVIHCLEALRILKELNYKPKHTLRVVFFMNEENGNMGGKMYADWSKNKGEKQVAAIESDRGGFTPRGFECQGDSLQVCLLASFEKNFEPYDLHIFREGYGGVDIGPLRNVFQGIPLYGFVPDSQRYFDFHHSPNDVFENVNKRELELGCASIAALVYLLDKTLGATAN